MTLPSCQRVLDDCLHNPLARLHLAAALLTEALPASTPPSKMPIISASRPVLGLSTRATTQKHSVAGFSQMARTPGLQCTRPRPHPVHPKTAKTPTSTSTLAQVTTRRTNSTAAGGAGGERLDWNTFFKLRAARRRYSVVSSVVTSAGTTVLGVQYLSTQDIESMGAQVMGLDPFVVLGMATMACGATGWLLGPFVGNAAWSMVNRRFTSSFATVGPPPALEFLFLGLCVSLCMPVQANKK